MPYPCSFSYPQNFSNIFVVLWFLSEEVAEEKNGHKAHGNDKQQLCEYQELH